jgi:uncharacterized membrane protein YdjX (TVP38/TMEM64 family)
MQEASPVSPRALAVGALLLLALTGLLILLIDWVGIEQLKDMIEGAGPLAPLLYILFKAAAYVFAPLSSGPVQLVAGLVFGVLPGTLYTVIGEVLGGTLSFLIARHLGRPAVQRFAGEAGLARIDEFVGQLGGWRALVYARFFLFAIYDFISYAAGFAKSITLRQYVLVSIICGTPPSFLFVYAGELLEDQRQHLLPLYALIGGLSLLPWLIHRALRSRRQRREEA